MTKNINARCRLVLGGLRAGAGVRRPGLPFAWLRFAGFFWDFLGFVCFGLFLASACLRFHAPAWTCLDLLGQVCLGFARVCLGLVGFGSV